MRFPGSVAGFRFLGEPPDPSIRFDPDAVLRSDHPGNDGVQKLLARLIFDQDFEVHSITSDPDSRCTTVRQGKPLRRHVDDRRIIAGASDAGEAILSLIEYPDLFRIERIDKIGLMGGDEDLRAGFLSGGAGTKLLDQCLEQLVVETILRLLDAQERRGIGIFQQQQVGEELQRPVRHLPRVERVLEAAVVEAQQQTTVRRSLDVNPVDPRNPVGDASQDRLEAVRMPLLHELHDVPEIVAVHVETPLRPRARQIARGVRREVAQIPVFDESAEGGNPRVPFQRTQRRDGEAARVFELDLLRLSRFVREDMVDQCSQFSTAAIAGIDIEATLACPDDTLPVLDHEKRE